MTDFELMYTFSEAFSGLTSLLTTYFSILFAFVAAAYLVAGKLSWALASIAVSLFTIAAWFLILLIGVVVLDMFAVASVIRDAVAEGQSSLGWVGFAGRRAVVVGPLFMFLAASLLVASYVGAVFFFFSQRRAKKR
jgi:hypothetical protein